MCIRVKIVLKRTGELELKPLQMMMTLGKGRRCWGPIIQ